MYIHIFIISLILIVCKSSFINYLHTQKSSREAHEGEDGKDFYANSKFEGICKGVEEDGSSNKLFCDTLCNICVAEKCKCIADHLGCSESYWKDDMKAAQATSGNEAFLMYECNGTCGRISQSWVQYKLEQIY